MLALKNLGRIVIAGACLFAIFAVTAETASARPQFKTAFEKAYPDLVKKHGKDGKLTCAVCHPVSDKKKRNDYGVALTKILGEKNLKDEAKIKEALEKTEKEKNADEKTYGELIKAGELPGKAEEAK